MKQTMRSWNSTLRTESQKHRELRLSGKLQKTRKPMRKISKSMRQRVADWRKTARDECTVNGQLFCALCVHIINDEQWDAHHYKQRRGQAHSIENDKYVVALHRTCHARINHYSEDFILARDRIELNLKKFADKRIMYKVLAQGSPRP